MSEEQNNTIEVACCAECPFVTPEPKCSESDAVEVDPDTMSDDIPSICPMLNGRPKVHGDKWVKLAGWILKQYPSGIED